MSKLELLLKRINKTEEPAKLKSPPETSQKLKMLLLRLETREWKAYAELELIEIVRDMEYEIRFINHALNCKYCLLELCLDVERHLGSHSGLWYLDLQNDPEYFMEIHPDAPDPRKYKFGSYWTRDEGQAIPFIKDRMKWAQNITKKQLRIADKLLEVVENWDFSTKSYERYEDLWSQLDIYISTPPLFWGAPLSEFCLEAFIKTNKQATHQSAIAPKKFSLGDHVKEIDPETNKPRPNTFSVIGYGWYGNRWLYEILPGVYTDEKYLIKSDE